MTTGEVIALIKAFGGGGGSSGSGGLVVNVDGQTGTCDKTALEMYQAVQSGLVLLRFKIESDGVVLRDRILPVIQVSMNASSEEKYTFFTYGDSVFIGATDSSYPVLDA